MWRHSVDVHIVRIFVLLNKLANVTSLTLRWRNVSRLDQAATSAVELLGAAFLHPSLPRPARTQLKRGPPDSEPSSKRDGTAHASTPAVATEACLRSGRRDLYCPRSTRRRATHRTGDENIDGASVAIFVICLLVGFHVFRWQGVNPVAMCDRQYIGNHAPGCRVPPPPSRA